jgi:hypothetical protein
MVAKSTVDAEGAIDTANTGRTANSRHTTEPQARRSDDGLSLAAALNVKGLAPEVGWVQPDQRGAMYDVAAGPGRPGRLNASAFSILNFPICMRILYVRAGRLTAKNGGSRPGQMGWRSSPPRGAAMGRCGSNSGVGSAVLNSSTSVGVTQGG